KVRHDQSDSTCTTAEGVRGQRAKDWKLVDDIAKPQEFGDKVRQRALALAEQSDRPAQAQGVKLTPLERQLSDDKLDWQYVSVAIDRKARTATMTVKAPASPQPQDARSEEHTSELQSREKLVCRRLLG